MGVGVGRANRCCSVATQKPRRDVTPKVGPSWGSVSGCLVVPSARRTLTRRRSFFLPGLSGTGLYRERKAEDYKSYFTKLCMFLAVEPKAFKTQTRPLPGELPPPPRRKHKNPQEGGQNKTHPLPRKPPRRNHKNPREWVGGSASQEIKRLSNITC